MSSSSTSCGLSWCGYPQYLQRFATTKSFIVVYGLLGIVQAMGFVYLTISLQTIEKRFKIPSQTTGLILSGNEVSQILLSVILSYFGGQRNRPRFISWGVIVCSLSCFILAMPHFLYGAGEDALRLTKEYSSGANTTSLENSALDTIFRKNNRLCMKDEQQQECGDEMESVVPLYLIFLSQFVLGIGNTLYFALGQTYLDDNTKKHKTPLLLSYAFALRTFGPAVGFVLAFACLKIYIDPTKTPLIDSKDPRWLGAWWLGWVILGIAQLFVAVLIGMFPKELPKKKSERPISDNIPKSLKATQDFFGEEIKPLKNETSSMNDFAGSTTEIPTLKQFPAAMMRLFKNKLLMCNVLSGIFYILGAAAYFTFMSKYMEVQFHKNAADATIITGPIMIFGVIIGLLASGWVISKKKPSPSKLLMWNVIVGFGYMGGQIANLYFTCPDGQTPMEINSGKINLTASCNADCHCEGFSYTPVCWEETGDTFFSPCVAHCNNYNEKEKYYYQCECTRELPKTSFLTTIAPTLPLSVTNPSEEYSTSFWSSSNASASDSASIKLPEPEGTMAAKSSPTASEPQALKEPQSTLQSPSLSPEKSELEPPTLSEPNATEKAPEVKMEDIKDEILDVIYETENVYEDLPKETTDDEDSYDDVEADKFVKNFTATDDYDDDAPEGDVNLSTEDIDIRNDRPKRSEPGLPRDFVIPDEDIWGKLVPGACIKGCAFGFYAFSIVSSIINCFGASGRIGNLLVNYRCVSKQDKSVTQGLILMLISLFALIPGPILFGRIIDSTCLVWTEQCSGRRGNCQLYDQRLFRYYINLTAFFLTGIGVFFDILVWKFGKNLDLYGDREEEMLKKQQNSRKI